MEPITKAVRELRGLLGDTQQQFAHRLGLAIATVVRYESTRPPKGKALAMLAELAAVEGFKEQAATLQQALAKEMGSWSTEGFRLDLEPRTDTERLWVSGTLAVLRNPQYVHLMPKLATLLSEPAAKSIQVLKEHIEGKKLRDEIEKRLEMHVEPDVIATDLNVPVEDVRQFSRLLQFQKSLERARKGRA